MNNIVFLSIITFIVIASIFSNILFKKRKKNAFAFGVAPKNPCEQCRYLSCNSYLKCALHPSVALTVHAIDCQDYHPKHEKKLVRNSRRLLEVVQNILLR
jgi:hypothetical protein